MKKLTNKTATLQYAYQTGGRSTTVKPGRSIYISDEEFKEFARLNAHSMTSFKIEHDKSPDDEKLPKRKKPAVAKAEEAPAEEEKPKRSTTRRGQPAKKSDE